MKKHLYIVLIIGFFVSACKDKIGPEECFMAAGKSGSREIVVNDFTSIIAKDRLVVRITQDTTQPQKVVLKGGGNVIKNVSVAVDNGQLIIDDRNVCNWTRDFSKKIIVEINCKTLHGITLNDAAEIEFTDTLQSDSLVVYQRSTGKANLAVKIGKFEVNHEATGVVDIKGYAAIFVPVMFDAGKLDARNLQGDYTFAYHYGINELHVKPFKVLYALVGNSGNILYYAEPVEQPLKVERLGSGNVERK